MTITEEDRTNPLGLFNSAERYREAADILASEHKALHFDRPIRYLFYHALELYLKAFLRADLPLDKVESLGHRFHELRDACTSQGLLLDVHEREVLTMIGADDTYIRARYIRTDYYQGQVAVKDLSWAAAAIAQKVGVQLRQRRIPLQRIEPSRLT
jgi:hypothetical protein